VPCGEARIPAWKSADRSELRDLTDADGRSGRDHCRATDHEVAAMSGLMWHVEVAFTEDGDRTRADAIVDLRGEHFHGVGLARRAPEDPSVPVVGEELAAARALFDLAHKLVEAATERIDGFGQET
jgi:hypothetical protein